jgi:hypothetical protein
MKWTVTWVDNSENELADIYMRAEDKASITSAAYRIEHELRNDPDKKGEDFYGDRIYQYGPLAVAFELIHDDLLVRVFQVIGVKEKR